MRIEIPQFLRCCFCIPLRYGILVFGYLSLIYSIFVLSFEAWLDIEYHHNITSESVFMYRGIGMITQVWFPYFLYITEVVFNIVLIVGAHIKCSSLIRAYYYYGITTTIAAFVTFIVVKYENQSIIWYLGPFELCLAISGLGVHIYLLLLIRSEFNKVRYHEGQFSYVNHMAEVTMDSQTECGRNPL